MLCSRCCRGGYIRIHVVVQGDNVDRIAQEYAVAASQIIYDNQLVWPYELALGQALLISEGEQPGRDVLANGFAYPFISRYVLEQSLPYLTELSIFSYGFTEEGELIAPVLETDWMIEAAYNFGTMPVLTLTPFGADGRFSNYLINRLLASEAAQTALIANLLRLAEDKGYGGINVDFEYILREDRDLFTVFVSNLTQSANAQGIYITVDLAPKTSSAQTGLLYEGKDYAGLGAAANSVILMTYEWGYTYGPPMAVAPLNKVREVVEYALTQIDRTKLYLGIPNYGYDWPLPYVRDTTRARTIGNIEAVRLAIANGAEIMFDEIAQSPYFNYIKDEVTHEVWFEDARSIQAKLRLRDEYELRGVAYWQIMQLFRTIWLLQQSGEFSAPLQ